jgi:hypothetical protein
MGLESKDAMSAIQIVRALAVPLLWGYQFLAIKVGVTIRLSSSSHFLAIADLLVPFVKRLAFVGVVVLAAGPGLSSNALALLLVVGQPSHLRCPTS